MRPIEVAASGSRLVEGVHLTTCAFTASPCWIEKEEDRGEEDMGRGVVSYNIGGWKASTFVWLPWASGGLRPALQREQEETT